MFQLDLKSRKSIYEQVVDNIKEQILAGLLDEEEKLPSVRDLSKVLTVNPNTVQKAYRELEYQGYVYTVSGLGTFVAKGIDRKPDATRKKELEQRLTENLKEFLFLGISHTELTQITQDILNNLQERRGTK